MPDKLSKVRITDIARRAKVSTGTVDRVIHNRGEVSSRTRERILSIIREMNYEPDIRASTLASKKSIHFASLIPEATSDSEFWSMPSAGLQRALEKVKHFGVSHKVFTFDYFKRNSFRQAAEELLKSKPDGVIIAPVFADQAETLICECKQNNIPVVLINANIFNLEKLSFVGQDSYRSGLVSAKLLDYGLKPSQHIFIINIMSEKGTNTHLLSREEGFRNYFKEKSTNRRKLHTVNIYGNSLQKIYEVLSDSLNVSPESRSEGGIFVTNSRVYLVAEFLKNIHIKKYRLVGYDLLDVNISHLQEGTIDFLISQKPIEQGYRSFMSLFDHVVMKRTIPTYQYLPIDIITRENIDYYLNDQ